MKKFIAAIILIPILFGVTACKEKKDKREKNSYNAFIELQYDNNRRVYVASTKGLSSCKYLVSRYFSKHRNHIDGKWDYVCCLRSGKDECAAEHRYKDD